MAESDDKQAEIRQMIRELNAARAPLQAKLKEVDEKLARLREMLEMDDDELFLVEEIERLRTLRDEAVRNAEYEEAARHRDSANAREQELQKLRKQKLQRASRASTPTP